jgi:hypothetical protein
LALWLQFVAVKGGGRVGTNRERKKEETDEWPRGKWETTMTGRRELPKLKHTPFEYPHRQMIPRQLDRRRRFRVGDAVAKFISSARTSSGKEGFRRRVRQRLMEFVGEGRTMV